MDQDVLDYDEYINGWEQCSSSVMLVIHFPMWFRTGLFDLDTDYRNINTVGEYLVGCDIGYKWLYF